MVELIGQWREGPAAAVLGMALHNWVYGGALVLFTTSAAHPALLTMPPSAYLAALAERYRVICPDLRGLGWTEAPSGGYDDESLASDVLALLDALELPGEPAPRSKSKIRNTHSRERGSSLMSLSW